MAFTPDDGSGAEDSNAYIDVAYFDTYHGDRGHASAVALDDSVKKVCIVRATDYIDKRFCRKFRGRRQFFGQALEWPRIDAFDDDNYVFRRIPAQLQKACAEYALRAAVYSELAPDPLMPVPTQDFTDTDLPTAATEQGPGAIAEIDEKVDVLDEHVRYFSPSQRLSTAGGKVSTSSLVAAGNIPEYPAADLLLEKLLTTGKRTLERG